MPGHKLLYDYNYQQLKGDTVDRQVKFYSYDGYSPCEVQESIFVCFVAPLVFRIPFPDRTLALFQVQPSQSPENNPIFLTFKMVKLVSSYN
jgi:hypothetical protein